MEPFGCLKVLHFGSNCSLKAVWVHFCLTRPPSHQKNNFLFTHPAETERRDHFLFHSTWWKSKILSPLALFLVSTSSWGSYPSLFSCWTLDYVYQLLSDLVFLLFAAGTCVKFWNSCWKLNQKQGMCCRTSSLKRLKCCVSSAVIVCFWRMERSAEVSCFVSCFAVLHVALKAEERSCNRDPAGLKTLWLKRSADVRDSVFCSCCCLVETESLFLDGLRAATVLSERSAKLLFY